MPNQYGQSQGREQLMRRVLRRSVPFVGAALIGTLTAATLAGLAMMISHF